MGGGKKEGRGSGIFQTGTFSEKFKFFSKVFKMLHWGNIISFKCTPPCEKGDRPFQ